MRTEMPPSGPPYKALGMVNMILNSATDIGWSFNVGELWAFLNRSYPCCELWLWPLLISFYFLFRDLTCRYRQLIVGNLSRHPTSIHSYFQANVDAIDAIFSRNYYGLFVVLFFSFVIRCLLRPMSFLHITQFILDTGKYTIIYDFGSRFISINYFIIISIKYKTIIVNWHF